MNLRPLEETRVVIQLADRSNIYLRGVVEDVLVQVNELVFPADFYIIDMEDVAFCNPTPILLGRPFLKTARAMINVHDGILTMELDGVAVKGMFGLREWKGKERKRFQKGVILLFG